MEGWPINPGDLGVLVVLLVSALLAFARGFVHEVLSIFAWIGAVVVALTYYPVFSPFLQQVDWPEWIPYVGVGGMPPWLADIASGVAVFLGTLLILSIISYYVSSLVRRTAVNAVDRSLGFVFGLVRGAVLVCLAYLLLVWLAPDPADHPQWVREARALPLVERGADLLTTLVPEDTLPEPLERTAATPAVPVLPDIQGTPQPAAPPPAGTPGYAPGQGIPLNQLIEREQNP